MEIHITAYERALQLMQGRGVSISHEVWNNVGVLRQKLGSCRVTQKHVDARVLLTNVYIRVCTGDLKGAEQAFNYALEKSGATETNFKAQNITTLYNLALLYEATHQYDKATSLYKTLLKEHPNYTDCEYFYSSPPLPLVQYIDLMSTLILGYLRLGCMARDRGHIFEAAEW